MNIEISIIVPVYNAEQSIQRCIKSILEQSYPHFQLILINDGSTDDSLKICQQNQSNDTRILVYSQPNSGVSVARNMGIKLCPSPYLCFVDSDDYLDTGYLANFIEGLAPNIDMVFQGINRCFTDHIEKIVPNRGKYMRKNLLEGISDINKFSIFGYVCTKIYKTEIIRCHQLLFDKNISISEDRIFALQYLEYCNGLSVINKSAYNYIIHNNGLTAHKHTFQEIKNAADINLKCALHLLTLLNSKRFEQDTFRMYIITSFAYLTALFAKSASFEKQKKEITQYLQLYSGWLSTYYPEDRYYMFLQRVLSTRNTFYIVITLRCYWALKKIKQLFNHRFQSSKRTNHQ